jgi:hypothetical protein
LRQEAGDNLRVTGGAVRHDGRHEPKGVLFAVQSAVPLMSSGGSIILTAQPLPWRRRRE